MARLQTVGYLAVCVLGIYASYLTQGVVQERLSTTKYGLLGARFSQMKSLNGIQSLTCFLWAALLVLPFKARRSGPQTAPWTAYWGAAVTNSVGPACGYEALKNISYPAQVCLETSVSAWPACMSCERHCEQICQAMTVPRCSMRLF